MVNFKLEIKNQKILGIHSMVKITVESEQHRVLNFDNLRYTQRKSVLKNLLSIGNIDKMAIVVDFFFSIHFDVLYLCLVDGVLPLYKMDKHYKRMEHFLICQVYCALLRATYISICQTEPAV